MESQRKYLQKRPARTAGNAIPAGRVPIEIRRQELWDMEEPAGMEMGRKGQAKRAQGGCLGTKGR